MSVNDRSVPVVTETLAFGVSEAARRRVNDRSVPVVTETAVGLGTQYALRVSMIDQFRW